MIPHVVHVSGSFLTIVLTSRTDFTQEPLNIPNWQPFNTIESSSHCYEPISSMAQKVPQRSSVGLECRIHTTVFCKRSPKRFRIYKTSGMGIWTSSTLIFGQAGQLPPLAPALHHNLASTTIGLAPDLICIRAHNSRASMSLWISSGVFPACRQIRTLSAPLGTVGHTIGRVRNPCSFRYAESGRALEVIMGMIGVGRAAGSRRVVGRCTIWDGISLREGVSLSMKV